MRDAGLVQAESHRILSQGGVERHHYRGINTTTVISCKALNYESTLVTL